jgi:uncharacterized protein YndB with AHSA1/START domain
LRSLETSEEPRMAKISTTHHTIVVKRVYDAKPARVFAAWSDPQALARWYVPGDGSWVSRVNKHEFRVGGAKHLAFGPAGGPMYAEDCRYEDIVDGERICFVMTILRGEARITTSMVTVEIAPHPGGAETTVTDQLVILSGEDAPDGREKGWGETLDKLHAELKRAS